MGEAAAIIISGLLAAGTSAYSSHEQASQAEKDRDLAREQYEQNRQDMLNQQKRLENIEAEKKKKALESHQRTPESVLTSGNYSGLQDDVTNYRKKLLGA